MIKPAVRAFQEQNGVAWADDIDTSVLVIKSMYIDRG
jgi:hypothetical protein